MSPHDVYLRARQHGLQIESTEDGQYLDVQPKGKCPPEFKEILRQHKPALLAWLRSQPCPCWGAVPPDDLPLLDVEPSPPASHRELVIGYILRQPKEPIYPWIVRRETAYFEGPGRHWDCAAHAYAAARDVACWQLNRTETEVWEVIEGLETE